MTRLIWNRTSDLTLSYGVEKGVIFPKTSKPVPWNGLISVEEVPEEGLLTTYYYDGQSYIKQSSNEGFSANVKAVTYPDEVDGDDEFDFCYSTVDGDDYSIHLVYNVLVTPADKPYEQDTPTVFEWKTSSTPEKISVARATPHLVISTNRTNQSVLSSLKDMLYGTESSDPRMPSASEVIALYDAHAIFVVTDNGDGTWTATGPDSWFTMLDATTFQITTPSAEYLTPDQYEIHSW